MRQLQRDDQPTKDLGDAALIQLLRIQGNDYNRKRSHNEPDDGSSERRPEDRPSKLRERNKMLASLLANPSKAPASFPTTIVKTIPDIPQSRMPNTGPIQQQQPPPSSTQQQQQQQQNNQKQIGMQQPIIQTRQPPVRKPSDVYLNQQMPTQQELSKNAQVKKLENLAGVYSHASRQSTLIILEHSGA